MKKLLKGISYAFRRNIGWQDRMIRTIVGIGATIGAFYFIKTNSVAAIALLILAAAQFWTVLSAKCVVCFLLGKCTIGTREKSELSGRQIEFEKI